MDNIQQIRTQTKFGIYLNEVYKDILGIEITMQDSFETVLNKFYDVMRKWNICQGTWTGPKSRLVANAEWIMCYSVFKRNKLDMFLDIHLVLNEPPDDLAAYGPKPEENEK